MYIDIQYAYMYVDIAIGNKYIVYYVDNITTSIPLMFHSYSQVAQLSADLEELQQRLREACW